MAENDREVGSDDLSSPFLFVPTGDSDPAAWKAAHPGGSAFQRPCSHGRQRQAQGNAGSDGSTWAKDRWGHRYRPLDEYAPGERAPGERSPGFPGSYSVGFGAMMAAMDV